MQHDRAPLLEGREPTINNTEAFTSPPPSHYKGGDTPKHTRQQESTIIPPQDIHVAIKTIHQEVLCNTAGRAIIRTRSRKMPRTSQASVGHAVTPHVKANKWHELQQTGKQAPRLDHGVHNNGQVESAIIPTRHLHTMLMYKNTRLLGRPCDAVQVKYQVNSQ